MKLKRSVVAVVLALISLTLFAVLGMRLSAGLKDNVTSVRERESLTRMYNGTVYYPKQDITTVLLIGIDDMGPVTPSSEEYNQSLADFLAVLTINETTGTSSILELNRDTMFDVYVTDLNGKLLGTTYGQLALAHTSGTGLNDSCVNTVNTVSKLLYGLKIDHYISLNMDAISILTDAVGGVTVNVTDDFSGTDPAIGLGQVTLNGEHALNFVRARSSVGDKSNLSRIERQKEFLRGAAAAFNEKKLSAQEIADVYDSVEPYMVTDCTTKAFNKLFDEITACPVEEILSVPGEARVGEKYMEYYMDEEALEEIVMRLFYSPKNTAPNAAD